MEEQLILLINRLNESFPDGDDLKGFPGISKAKITTSLTESIGLTEHFKIHEDNFDVVILKREVSRLSEKAIHDLDKDFNKIDAAKFNSLLNTISKIRLVIRDTYVAIINVQPLRTEAQIGRAKEELDSLQLNNESLRRIATELNALRDSTLETISKSQTTIQASSDQFEQLSQAGQKEIETAKNTTISNITEIAARIKETNEIASKTIDNLTVQLKAFVESEAKITATLAEITNHKTTIEGINENVTQWRKDILSTKADLLKQSEEYTKLNSRFIEVQKEIDNVQEKIGGKIVEGAVKKKGFLQETEDLRNQLLEFLGDQKTRYNTQFTEIEGLLPGATSAGLAEAYQAQKLSYRGPMRLWSWVFIGTMVLMTGLSVALLYNQFINPSQLTVNEALISLLKDLPFFIPTIWLAAYASKQQSQYKRLQQEYAFKETNAKSFHGHKMQIEELMKDGATDKELLMQLVAQLVIITSQNPSITLDSKSHDDSPPILKLIEKYIPSFKRT